MKREHKEKIAESIRKHYAKRRRKIKEKYPRLPEAMNRAKKLSLVDIISIQELFKFGLTIKEIHKEFQNVTYHCVYYHTRTEEERRTMNHRGNIRARERIQADPEIRARTNKQSIASRKYRREVMGKDWLAWDAKLSRKRHLKKTIN